MDPTGLVPEGYAAIHPNVYWDMAHGPHDDYSEEAENLREMNPMPYPRPLAMLSHEELQNYRDFIDGHATAKSKLTYTPNLSEEERLRYYKEFIHSPAANWNEDFKSALRDELQHRADEQHVDAQRRGNLHGRSWGSEGYANPEGGLLFSQSFQDKLASEPMEPFEQAWALVKVDFTFDEGDDRSGFWDTEEDDSDPLGWVNLSSPHWRRDSSDEDLVGDVVNTARHESIHEGLQQQPEMAEALRRARQSAEKGNHLPLTQFNVVHEAMANFQDRASTPSHLRENVKEYPWSERKREHWNESQKVKQGEWREDDEPL